MTNSSDESEADQQGISDDQLPDDLKPGEDNPLAEGLDSGETAGDEGPGALLEEGKSAEEGEQSPAEAADPSEAGGGDDEAAPADPADR